MNSEVLNPQVHGIFDSSTWTVTYIVHDGPGSECAIIDSVLDYDSKSGRTSTHSAEKVVKYVKANGLMVKWILETHAHADHLSAASWLRQQLGGKIAIGEHITRVQARFQDIFNLGDALAVDGSQFDVLLKHGDCLSVGPFMGEVMHVPGHTPACVAYRFGNTVFVGDTLFMPDVGTARCDFPGGDARRLYHSIRQLLTLPATTRLFLCHDYPPQGRDICYETTVAEQRAHNIHMHDGVGEEEFVVMRTQRDVTLEMPVLMLPAVQVNIRAGCFPSQESNGVSYLKIPLNFL